MCHLETYDIKKDFWHSCYVGESAALITFPYVSLKLLHYKTERVISFGEKQNQQDYYLSSWILSILKSWKNIIFLWL